MTARALQIFVLQDGHLLSSEVFADGSFTIGSEPDCDLVLSDELIAPMHAVLKYTDGHARLIDQDSPAGTLVNGQPITETLVTSADDIHIGPYLLKLRQLTKKRPVSSTPPSGYAGAPVTVLRPRTSTSVSRRSSSMMPTPGPSSLSGSLARALSSMPAQVTPPPAPVIPLRPAPIIDQDLDVDALLKHLERAPALPEVKSVVGASSDPITMTLTVPEPTLRDASGFYAPERTTAPAAPLWIEVPENEVPHIESEVIVDFDDEEGPAVASVEDLSKIELPAPPPSVKPISIPPPVITAQNSIPPPIERSVEEAAPVSVPPPSSIPPPIAKKTDSIPPQRPVPVIAPRKSIAPSVLEDDGPEQLHVTIFWGKHRVLRRTFERGEAVVAAPDESAKLPLYGFSLIAASTLAKPTDKGWNVHPCSGARMTARDNAGRWQPAAATIAHGVTLMLNRAVRLSLGDVHVEFERQPVPPVTPKRAQRKPDRLFPALVALLSLVVLGLMVFVPKGAKARSVEDVQRVQTYVRALFERHPEWSRAPAKRDSAPTSSGVREQKPEVKHAPQALRVIGQIDMTRLADTINAHVGELRDCYVRELLHNPGLGAGTVMLEWTIGSNGAVSNAWVSESKLNTDGADGCFLDVIRELTFPKPQSEKVVVNYPMVFDGREF
jgi:predicted component of type VI protein secretion system